MANNRELIKITSAGLLFGVVVSFIVWVIMLGGMRASQSRMSEVMTIVMVLFPFVVTIGFSIFANIVKIKGSFLRGLLGAIVGGLLVIAFSELVGLAAVPLLLILLFFIAPAFLGAWMYIHPGSRQSETVIEEKPFSFLSEIKNRKFDRTKIWREKKETKDTDVEANKTEEVKVSKDNVVEKKKEEMSTEKNLNIDTNSDTHKKNLNEKEAVILLADKLPQDDFNDSSKKK